MISSDSQPGTSPPKHPLQVAFIGGGPRSAVGYAHYAASKLDGCWNLAAGVFSREADENRKAGLVYGVDQSRVYDTAKDLIENERELIDAVVVLSPTPLHLNHVNLALSNGVGVICEKALASSSSEIESLQNLQRKTGQFLGVVYNYSGYPMVREMRSLIRRGIIGEVLHVDIEMPQESFVRVGPDGTPVSPQSWRLEDGEVPVLYLDLAAHVHQLSYYLTGLRVRETIAHQSSSGLFSVIDNVSSLCSLGDGVNARFWFSKSALGSRNGLRIRVYGAEASLDWIQGDAENLWLFSNSGQRILLDRGAQSVVAGAPRYNRFKVGHPAGFIEALANLYFDFSQAIEEHSAFGVHQTTEVFGSELALEGLKLFEAMVRSSASRQWEPVR